MATRKSGRIKRPISYSNDDYIESDDEVTIDEEKLASYMVEKNLIREKGKKGQKFNLWPLYEHMDSLNDSRKRKQIRWTMNQIQELWRERRTTNSKKVKNVKSVPKMP